MKYFKYVILWIFLLSQVVDADSVRGYMLPPEPEPSTNNATLIGVDINKNDVRDDLERSVIQIFNGDKVYIESTFQMIRAYKMIMQTYDTKNMEKDESKRTKEMIQTFLTMGAAKQCSLYFGRIRYQPQYGFNKEIVFGRESILNTHERKMAEAMFDKSKTIMAFLMNSKGISNKDIKKLNNLNKKNDLNFLKSQCTFDVDKLIKGV